MTIVDPFRQWEIATQDLCHFNMRLASRPIDWAVRQLSATHYVELRWGNSTVQLLRRANLPLVFCASEITLIYRIARAFLTIFPKLAANDFTFSEMLSRQSIRQTLNFVKLCASLVFTRIDLSLQTLKQLFFGAVKIEVYSEPAQPLKAPLLQKLRPPILKAQGSSVGRKLQTPHLENHPAQQLLQNMIRKGGTKTVSQKFAIDSPWQCADNAQHAQFFNAMQKSKSFADESEPSLAPKTVNLEDLKKLGNTHCTQEILDRTNRELRLFDKFNSQLPVLPKILKQRTELAQSNISPGPSTPRQPEVTLSILNPESKNIDSPVITTPSQVAHRPSFWPDSPEIARQGPVNNILS